MYSRSPLSATVNNTYCVDMFSACVNSTSPFNVGHILPCLRGTLSLRETSNDQECSIYAPPQILYLPKQISGYAPGNDSYTPQKKSKPGSNGFQCIALTLSKCRTKHSEETAAISLMNRNCHLQL